MRNPYFTVSALCSEGSSVIYRSDDVEASYCVATAHCRMFPKDIVTVECDGILALVNEDSVPF